MKKRLICLLIIVLVGTAFGAITTVTNWKLVDPELAGNTTIAKAYLTPTDTAPTAAEGWLYWDDSEAGLKVYDGTQWVLLGTSGSAVADNTLDKAYDEGGVGAGRSITADSGAVVITNTDIDAAFLLEVTPTPAGAGATGGISIVSGANCTEDSLQITNGGSGDDIQAGAGVFKVSAAGAITGAGLTLGPAAASTITIASDGGADDLTISVTGATDSSVKVASTGTGADAISLITSAGGLDITVGGTAAAGEDLDISSVSSVNITSTEAGVSDSIVIQASGAASGIDIVSLENIDISTTGAATEDITLTNTGGSINLSASEADAAAITITASANGGGIDIAAQNDIDIVMTNGAAGEDISLTNGGGSVILTASEAAADAIKFNASDAAGGITVAFGTGNMAIAGAGASADFTVSGDIITFAGIGPGGFTITSDGNADDLTIAVAGNTDSSVKVASSGTGGDAISLITSAGGMDLTVAGAAAGEDLDITANSSVNISSTEAAVMDSIVISAAGAGSGIDITSLADIDITTTGAATEDISIINTGGSLLIRANEDAADVLTIDTAGGGGTTEAINILNDQGTGDASLNIDSTAGGFDLDAAKSVTITSSENTTDAVVITASAGGVQILASAAAATEDITITATGSSVNINATENDAGAIAITANGGTTEAITLTASQGTGAASIGLVSTAGGITLNSAAAGITCSGDILKGYSRYCLNDTDNETLGAAQSGGVFTNQDDANNQVYTLPAAVIGMQYTFADIEAGAAADLYILAVGNDTIAGGVAANYLACKQDAVSQTITLLAVSDTEWIIINSIGTWAPDDVPD